MSINKKDIIRFHKKVSLQFTESGFIISIGDQSIKKSASILKLLEVFQKWISIEEGLKEIAGNCKGKNTFISASADFHDLLKKGFFEFKNSDTTRFQFHNGKFDSFPVHLRMLNDKARTQLFQKAIRETVTANDIVLDIGTGNGILAATAAMAGAKHVYAIERTGFIEVARAVFKANKLENKITLIQGDSTAITLPEKATVLVSEIIGNEAFGEGILHTFNDARERLLTADARCIPEGLKIFAVAMEVNAEKYGQNMLSDENMSQWKNWYGVDFSPFHDFIDASKLPVTNIKSIEAKKWKMLSSAIEIAQADFTKNKAEVKNQEVILKIENEGDFNAVLLFFECALTSRMQLSMHPEKVDTSNHWSSRLHFIPAVKAKKGSTFTLNHTLKNLKSELRITAQSA